MRDIVSTENPFELSKQQYISQLINKWEQWLVEGPGRPAVPEHLWGQLALLLENQWQVSTRAYAAEATMTTDVSLPVKYALPIVRQVYPQLILSKIASIQAMPMTSGGTMQIFYQDFKREDVTPHTSLTTPDSDYGFRGENEVPRRVKMEITSETVTAVKSILGATWSTEIEEDAMGALNIDVGRELTVNCAQEILRELEEVCLNEILAGATAGNVTWSWTVPAGYQDHQWYETLHHKFIDMENLIITQRHRNADFIVCGRNVVSYLMKSARWSPSERNIVPGPRALSGVRLEGRVSGFWDVYSTPYINTNRAFMGIYPSSQIDTAYVFSPYIPLDAMPLVYAEFKALDDATMPGAYVNTDKWSRNVRTRNARKLVVPTAFATLTISA